MALSNYLREPVYKGFNNRYNTSFFTQPTDNATTEQSLQSAAATPVNTSGALAGDMQVVQPEKKDIEQRPVPTTIPDLMDQLYPKVDLSKDIEKAERDRKRHLFGNVATVLGQGLGSLIGARQFTPIQNNDNYYQQRIDQLRNLQRGYDADRAKTMATLQLNELQAQRNAAIAAQQAAQKHAYDLNALAVKDKYEQDKEQRQHGYDVEKREHESREKQADRESRERINTYTQNQNNARAAANRASSEKIAKMRYGDGVGSGKGAVAYSGSKGDIYLNNTKDKDALTYKAVSMMLNNPSLSWNERSALERWKDEMDNGNVKSLRDAELYVNRHLDDPGNEAVWEAMVDYGNRYGHVSYYGDEEDDDDTAPYLTEEENDDNTAPYLNPKKK